MDVENPDLEFYEWFVNEEVLAMSRNSPLYESFQEVSFVADSIMALTMLSPESHENTLLCSLAKLLELRVEILDQQISAVEVSH